MDQSPDPSSPITRRIGRNEPCPCTSGKKYKRCCALRPKDDVVITWHDDLDELLEISNRANDLVHVGRLDDAERLCHELERRWPDDISWRYRFAELHEARGDTSLAAQHYRLAAEFARTHDGFDDDAVNDFLDSAERLDPSPHRGAS
jgi:tetratricopeptide (TPR) repeat protein